MIADSSGPAEGFVWSAGPRSGARFEYEGIRLSSIRQINGLPKAARHALYRSLVPDRVLALQDAGVPPPLQGQMRVRVRSEENASFAEIDVRDPAAPRDPVLYVQIADTASGQLQVLLMTVNDPRAPRFGIDRDWQGESTKLGTLKRNIPGEVEAMKAGLAPGQVRRGLRLSGELVPLMEQLATGLGKDRFFIDPLAYHNAIMFERYGFSYMTGRVHMEQIHRGFQPGGVLVERLDGSTPFRQLGAERTVRGRSWAIHDGILGEAWSGARMHKRVAYHAKVCTFPNAVY